MGDRVNGSKFDCYHYQGDTLVSMCIFRSQSLIKVPMSPHYLENLKSHIIFLLRIILVLFYSSEEGQIVAVLPQLLSDWRRKGEQIEDKGGKTDRIWN